MPMGIFCTILLYKSKSMIGTILPYFPGDQVVQILPWVDLE